MDRGLQRYGGAVGRGGRDQFVARLKSGIATPPPAAGLIVVLIAALYFYLPALNQWFFADDFLFLRQSQTTGWSTWLVQTWDYRDPRPVPEFSGYRPMFFLTFRAEYSLFGLHAFGYHAVLLAVHLAAVAVLWFIALRLTRRPWAAHLAALVFAIHPTYADAVSWISNGNHPMAVLFYLLAFLLFMKYADGGAKHFVWYGGFLVSYVVALLYHPMTLPLVIVVVSWYFLVQSEPRQALRPAEWVRFLPIIVVLIPYLAIQRWVRAHDIVQLTAYGFGPHVYRNYVDYLGLAAYKVTKGSLSAHIVAALGLLVSLMLLLSWRSSRVSVFAVLWFYTSLLPASLPRLGTGGGRLLYDAGAPLGVFVACAVMLCVETAPKVAPRALTDELSKPFYTRLGAVLLLYVAVFGAMKFDLIPPNPSPIVRHHTTLNERLLQQLRASDAEFPADGTVYIVNPPPFLVHLNQEVYLRDLVRIYYGEVEVKMVPLRQPPFWGEEQVRRALRPEDRIIVFK